MFGGLAEQINDISSIRLQNSNSTLIFNKQENGLWQLEGYPHYLVYQNRIRSFLSALLEAAYYEKKASGLENLPAFGLTPIENGNSSAVQVTLSDNRKNRLLQFDVGKYDLDLGRGSRGAYIRFDNSFQVWLAQIDLIDLSLDPLAWTYSTLWNLQFGRVSEINGSTDPDALADIVKELLNIHFAGTAAVPAEHTQPPAEEKDSRPADSEPENAEKPIRRLDIRAEGGLHITIRFYQDKSGYLAVYQFNNISSSKLLQNFAAYAKDVAYQISAEDMNRLARSYHFRLTDTNR